jgi:hypothetical protein
MAVTGLLGLEASYPDILFVVFSVLRCILFASFPHFPQIRYFSLPITHEIVAPSPKLRSNLKEFEDICTSTLVKGKN